MVTAIAAVLMVTAVVAGAVVAGAVVAACGIIVRATVVDPPALTWRFQQPRNPRPLVGDPYLHFSRAPSKPEQVG